MKRVVLLRFVVILLLALAVSGAFSYYFIGRNMLQHDMSAMLRTIHTVDYALDYSGNLQEQVERLQVELRRFKTELADVEINAELQVTVEGFMRFADFFFDNLFTDWAVLDHIGHAKAQVRDTRKQIERVLARLKRINADLDAQLEDERERREQIAIDAE